ncbi:SGNH/GDSL hydrolase family protein [Actinoplanes sichuanensis]|uniref:SGNH/GDSL hydrolase family protein n=1 Tax=Actinoplanes sichuanensis TaxID=512349 RepID=A0ABW4A5I4_9ACTN|nr:SGNH/GDSL hydrolase family protein [Actinoplanes sichuanensis]
MRAGGLLATGVAVTAATSAPARASHPAAVLPLLTWHAALANRRYAPAVVAVLGSSSSEGVGASGHGRGYVSVLTENLRTAFPVAGAPGGDNYVAAWGTPRWWPVTGGGTRVNTAGWGLKAVDLGGPGESLTYTFAGTSVRVWHEGSPEIVVDGRTVVVRGPGRIHGFATFDGDEEKGIQVYNGGHGGRTSGDFASRPAAWAPRLRSMQPHLVILQLGVNDWRIGVSAAEMKRNLVAIIATVRANTVTSPSFVIYGTPRVGADHRVQDYTGFTEAWREIAAEDTGGPGGASGVAYFDLAARQLSPSSDNHHGLYCEDLVHMSDRGAAFTADALLSFIRP